MKFASLGVVAFLCTTIGATASAGGRPDQVPFPGGYATSFMNYSLANRASGKPELAKIFANSTAQKSAGAGGALAPGSVLVMEIYQALRDEAGNPVIESDGVFKSGELTGIAVMQKRADWPAEYPAQERAGEWGFALYDAKGQPKANDLVCAGCHQPFAEQDFVISRPRLAAAIR